MFFVEELKSFPAELFFETFYKLRTCDLGNLSSVSRFCYEFAIDILINRINSNRIEIQKEAKSFLTKHALRITSLKFSCHCDLVFKDLKWIAAFPKLRELYIDNSVVDDAGAEALAKCTTLEKIEIIFGKFTSAGCEALSKMPKLKKLTLWMQDFGDDAIQSLMTNENLDALDLTGNSISTKGAVALAVAANLRFQKNALLYQQMKKQAAKQTLDEICCSEVIQNRNLTCLNLSHTAIGDEGVKALATITCLKSLTVRWAALSPTSAKALSKNTNLTYLNLSTNLRIGDEGAMSLAGNQNIITLSLDCCGISSIGAIALAANQTFTSLDLNCNSIDNDGIIALARNRRLKMLWLDFRTSLAHRETLEKAGFISKKVDGAGFSYFRPHFNRL